MTNKQRRILEDAEISSELMHEVDHYLKDVGAVLSGTIHEKENYLTMLCNDIAEFVDVNPSASINNIIGEFGTPEKHADVFLENKWLSLWGVFTTLHRDSGFFGQIVRIGMQKNTIYPPLRRTVYQVNQLQAVFFRSLF